MLAGSEVQARLEVPTPVLGELAEAALLACMPWAWQCLQSLALWLLRPALVESHALQCWGVHPRRVHQSSHVGDSAQGGIALVSSQRSVGEGCIPAQVLARCAEIAGMSGVRSAVA